MISKEAIKRGYNRGNYTVGAHAPGMGDGYQKQRWRERDAD